MQLRQFAGLTVTALGSLKQQRIELLHTVWD
jgi:hypothetical protein